MGVKIVFCFFILKLCSAAQVYDAYFGEPLANNDNRRLFLASSNVTGSCTVIVEDCRKDEGRRVDGTCTNPKYPSRGATLTPLPRLLPPIYGPGNAIRTSKYGNDLPSTRLIRTTILGDGFIYDHPFTVLASHVFVFSFVDNVDLFYLLSYAAASDCCTGNTPNRADPRCISIDVPADDPYLRREGIRCMNLTRVETFQDRGCLPNTLPVDRYSRPTPLLDLSIVYGYTAQREREVRTFAGGEIRSERRDNREVPPGNAASCIMNKLPLENTCYQFGDSYDGNLLTGIALSSLLFYREHNRIARDLAIINPCWDDQTLFEVARQINIAQWQFIFFYELIPNFIGWKNALVEGIIHDTEGYVNDFDYKYEPGVYREYVIGSRWFHTFQTSRFDLYNRSGEYLYTRETVADAFRSGIFENNRTESGLTNGAYRQSAAKFDDVMDIDLSERLYNDIQAASDLPAIDMMRGRDAGFQSYNAYRKLCGMPVARTFKDFHDTIDPEKVLQLSRIYDDVDDVDLMAAIYAERIMPGTYVVPTLYCIMINNLKLWRKSDRFFFEHGDYEKKFTLPQLNEIRKTSIANILCNNGDEVQMIQPHAFIKEHKGNKITSCKKIRSVDLYKWRVQCNNDDNKCNDDDNMKNDDKRKGANDGFNSEMIYNKL